MLDTKIVSLLTLITCKSYTKAAKQLHLTQPAISHQIKQLEEIPNQNLSQEQKTSDFDAGR